MTKYIKSLKGVTLIELIIVIVILGTVLTIATTMIIQAFNIVNPSSERMSAKQLAEIHLTEISKYVRNGEDIELVNGNIEKDGEIIIHNIKDFEMTLNNGIYTITLTKKIDDQENDITVTRKVSPRN